MRGAVSLLSSTIAAALLLVACSSDSSDAPDAAPDSQPPVDGTESFSMKIKPLVRRCINCHGIGLNMPNLTSFTALEARYKIKPGRLNLLVTKADNSGGMHAGLLYFDVDEKKVVADWIDSLPNP